MIFHPWCSENIARFRKQSDSLMYHNKRTLPGSTVRMEVHTCKVSCKHIDSLSSTGNYYRENQKTRAKTGIAQYFRKPCSFKGKKRFHKNQDFSIRLITKKKYKLKIQRFNLQRCVTHF